MSFTRFRNWMLISPILGLTTGSIAGGFLGGYLSSGWGDLVLAVFGIWLGGPLGALIAFQLLLGRLEQDVDQAKARVVNLTLALFSATVVLGVLSLATRAAIPAFLLLPVIVGVNLVMSYFILVATLRVARK